MAKQLHLNKFHFIHIFFQLLLTPGLQVSNYVFLPYINSIRIQMKQLSNSLEFPIHGSTFNSEFRPKRDPILGSLPASEKDTGHSTSIYFNPNKKRGNQCFVRKTVAFFIACDYGDGLINLKLLKLIFFLIDQDIYRN